MSMSPWTDGRHPGAVEEWVFSAWTPDASLGVISGHRLIGATAWYWAACARADRPLLHIADFEIPVRGDPFIVKGEALWAEHVCDAPMEQWSIGNETYAVALDPDEALGRAYGTPTPIAFDLEWYATDGPSAISHGYEQRGVVHGAIDVLDEERTELAEVPAHRWHRWAEVETGAGGGSTAGPAGAAFGPAPVSTAVAHTGVRAPFALPDGDVLDLVLTPSGWRRRR